MRTHSAAILAIALACAGCNHDFLKDSTLRSSGTLSALQNQQVLNNLALLATEPASNVCHVNLSSGTIQATDLAAGSVLGNVFSTGLSSDNSFVPAFSAQRTLVSQWVVNPVTDGEQLETLRIAYSKALNPNDHDVEDQLIAQIVELCVRFSILPQKETIYRILQRDDPHRPVDPKTKVEQLIKSLDAEIEQYQQHLATMQTYADAWDDEKTKESLELHLQILDLKEKVAFRTSQRDVLVDLKTGTDRSTLSVRKPAIPSRNAVHEKQFAAQSDTLLLILTVLQAGVPIGYLPATDLVEMSTRNAALVDQAEDQLGRLEALFTDPKFQRPWVCTGTKKDVPRDACYVGCPDCRDGTYIWIDRADANTLHEFTQIILTLAAPNTLAETPSFGPVFSPGH